jgi:hypothetical protein
MIGHLSHTAGIHDADVSNFSFANRLNTRLLQLLTHAAGLCEIEFTAQREIGGFQSLELIHNAKIMQNWQLCKLKRFLRKI